MARSLQAISNSHAEEIVVFILLMTTYQWLLATCRKQHMTHTSINTAQDRETTQL
jgi:hypothetical protein